jgi:hypothetical protein
LAKASKRSKTTLQRKWLRKSRLPRRRKQESGPKGPFF